MAVVSKEFFDAVYRDVPCNMMSHPWSDSCIKAQQMLFKASVVGSAKFYGIVYLLQILMKGRKMTQKEQWIKMGGYYLRSTLFGLIVTVVSNILCCTFRLSLGKFTYRSYLFVPFFLNGIFIYLEPPSRRGLVINLFCNLLIEYYLRALQRSGFIAITNFMKVLMFMTGSSLLFYLMRLEAEKKQKTPIFWMFTPEKVKLKSRESPNVCPHEGKCVDYIFKGCRTYFGLGFGISLARHILPQIKTPVKAIYSIKLKHFKLALFFSSYIGIYRAVICYLCHKRGFDSAMHALPAGYAAGISLIFNPSLGLSIASLTAAFKLYSTILYEKKILPSNVPLPEILYCLCQGTLLSARVIDPDVCPGYVFNLMRTVSAGKADMIAKSFNDILQRTL